MTSDPPATNGVALNRAYRSLARLNPVDLWASVGFLVVFEWVLVAYRVPLVDFVGGRIVGLTVALGLASDHQSSEFWGMSVPLVSFRLPDSGGLVLPAWGIGALLACWGIVKVRRLAPAFRYFFVCNFFLIAAAAFYGYFVHSLAFRAESFMQFYLRAIIVIWLTVPLFLGMTSLALPFSTLERMAVTLGSLAYGLIFSSVKYVLFMWLFSHVGEVLLLCLYCFWGPLLDIVQLTGGFAFFLARLSRRIGDGKSGRGERVWKWR